MADGAAVLAGVEVFALEVDVAIGLHEGIARLRGGPEIVQGVDRDDGGAHLGVAGFDALHGRVVEEVMGIAAPVAPLAIDVARQVFAQAQGAPGAVALPPGQHRQDQFPHGQHLESFQRRHIAVPAGAGAEDIEAGHLGVVGQEAEGVAAIGVADQVEGDVALGHAVHGGGEVLARPVQQVHAKALERGRRRTADAAVIEGQGLETAGRGVLGETSIEALGHGGGAGDDQPSLQRPLGGIATGAEAITVRGDQLLDEGVAGHGVVPMTVVIMPGR